MSRVQAVRQGLGPAVRTARALALDMAVSKYRSLHTHPAVFAPFQTYKYKALQAACHAPGRMASLARICQFSY